MREVKNDRLSHDQLMELVRKAVKTEVRRERGATSDLLNVAVPGKRFILPINLPASTSQQAAGNVHWALIAGCKTLRIKRIALQGSGAKVPAGGGSATALYSLARFTGRGMMSVGEVAASSEGLLPVCITDSRAKSTYLYARQAQATSTLFTTPATIPAVSKDEDIIVLSMVCHSDVIGTQQRLSPIVLGCEADDTILELEPGAGLMLYCSRAAGTTPSGVSIWGFVEWEEDSE